MHATCMRRTRNQHHGHLCLHAPLPWPTIGAGLCMTCAHTCLHGQSLTMRRGQGLYVTDHKVTYTTRTANGVSLVSSAVRWVVCHE